ncbi:SPO19 (YPL130W) and YOR214C [Zygosaccharomyces parabailii]|nr:SPO19 (YPL130W) and YOR214C [Zygosaccharomyces parabailii]
MHRIALASSVAGLTILTQNFALGYSDTFDPAEFAGVTLAEDPLAIHVDPKVLSPEVLEKLSSSSNIVFADLPNSPQFVSLKDYESIKYATNELLDELLQQDDSGSGPLKEELSEDNQNVEPNIDEKVPHLLSQIHENASEEDGADKSENSKPTEATTTTWEKSCSSTEASSISHTCSSSASYTSIATATEPPSSEEKTYSVSYPTENYEKPCKTSASWVSDTISKSITSKHYQRSRNISCAYPTSIIKHPKNYTNHTNNTLHGFHNSSNSIVPTTMFLAFLLSILLFTQMC